MLLAQKDEIASFFCMSIQFMEIKSWLKTAGMGEFQNGCDLSGYKILKLAAITQEEISWFFACW